jgi:hypothetical protein
MRRYPFLFASSLCACCATSRAATPVNDLGTGLYLNQYQGGLYPGGSNAMPAPHAALGASRASNVVPLNAQGQPDPAGKFVFLSIGMSNTSQEFSGLNHPTNFQPWTFMGQAAAHPAVNHSSMVLFNGARGGETAAKWDSPTDENYARVATELAQAGLSEQQVRVAWVKVANPNPAVSLPAGNSDALTLVRQTGSILRTLHARYPNLEQVFLSSRIYAGYATTTLNPEPYAYESGFAMKRVIEAQINQTSGGGVDPIAGNLDPSSAAPWVAWGPYLWADGTNPRSDGLVWLPTDLQSDGTHPSQAGQTKVGRLLMRHFINSPLAEDWFLDYAQGDANLDGTVNLSDFNALAANFGQSGRTWQQADFTYDGQVTLDDFNALAANFGMEELARDPTPEDWSALAAAIPEPAMALWAVPLTMLSHRRRRRSG